VYGPLVQLVLATQHGGIVEVDVFREQADALALTRGQRLYYRPRQLRVFPEAPIAAPAAQPEYSI